MKKISILLIAIIFIKIAASQSKALIRGNTGLAAVSGVIVFPPIDNGVNSTPPPDLIDIGSAGYFQKTNVSKALQQNKHLTDNALAIVVTDVSGNTRHLSEVLNQHKGSIFFVDFWASWCDPCIREIPYLKDLEKKYDNKIVFISLSGDHRDPDWLAATRKYQLTGNQYLMSYGSKNALIKELNVKMIPRFLLMKANGKVLNDDLPKPREAGRVGKIIDKALAETAAMN